MRNTGLVVYISLPVVGKEHNWCRGCLGAVGEIRENAGLRSVSNEHILGCRGLIRGFDEKVH